MGNQKFTATLTWSANSTVFHLVEDGPVPPIVPGVFLVLCFSVGLCLNLVIAITVVTTSVLRRLSYNRILLHFCLVCSLECFLNVTGAVAFVAVTHLDIQSNHASELLLGCRINAALTQWTMSILSVTLAALVTDRVMTLCQQDDLKSTLNNRFMRLIPMLLWVYGTALVAPIVATTHIVEVRPFPDRYSCGILPTSEESEALLYPSLLFILGYIIPWIIIIILVIIIMRHIISTRRRQIQLEEAALQRSQGRTSLVGLGASTVLLHSTSYQTSWSNLLGNSGPLSWEEVKLFFLSSLILMLYIVLLVPHILCVNIPSLTTMLPSAPIAQNNSSSSNNTLASEPPELKPIHTGTYDCLFIWCRYNFTILVPIVIFLIHKEVRKKCEHMFCCCCCQNNAVVHLDTARSISACVEKRAQLSEQDIGNQPNKQISRRRLFNKKDKYTRIAHYRTPVLFATTEGLHLRLVDDKLEESYYLNEGDIGSPGAAGGKEQCWAVEPRFLCEFCDVAIITSTPIEGHNLQQSFGASTRKGLRPPVFGDETLAEKDLHVSDEPTGESSREFARKLFEVNDSLVPRNNAVNNRNVPINSNRKIPRVRFAQTVSEIPLSESGVWSAPEDQGLYEQSLNKKNESQDIALNSFRSKPPGRGRTERTS